MEKGTKKELLTLDCETAGGRKVKVIGTPTKEEGYGRGFREIEETTPYGTKRRVVHRSMLKQKVNGGRLVWIHHY